MVKYLTLAQKLEIRVPNETLHITMKQYPCGVFGKKEGEDMEIQAIKYPK